MLLTTHEGISSRFINIYPLYAVTLTSAEIYGWGRDYELKLNAYTWALLVDKERFETKCLGRLLEIYIECKTINVIEASSAP